MTDHITTLAVMQSQYSHIRQSDAEWEAIEAAKDALDQVATLQAENGSKDKLLLEVTAKYETAIKIQAQIVELQKRAEAALSRVEAERDAAVEDIRFAVVRDDWCILCAHYCVDGKPAYRPGEGYLEFCMDCGNGCRHFEWRGAQGEA